MQNNLIDNVKSKHKLHLTFRFTEQIEEALKENHETCGDRAKRSSYIWNIYRSKTCNTKNYAVNELEIIHLWLMIASGYRLKHRKGSWCHKSFPELRDCLQFTVTTFFSVWHHFHISSSRALQHLLDFHTVEGQRLSTTTGSNSTPKGEM